MADEPKALIPLTVPIMNPTKAPSSVLPPLQRITASLYQLNGIQREGKPLWDKESLCSIWYGMVGEDLAHSFKAQPGYKLIVNGNGIQDLGKTVRKLLQFADFIAIRDTRDTIEPEAVTVALIPGWELYDRSDLRKSDTPILLRQTGKAGSWSSTTEEIAGFGKGVWALHMSEKFDSDIYEWLFREGRAFHESGQVIFAPMIPPVSIELEFLRNGVDLPKQFGADSLWTNRFDYIDQDEVLALSLIDVPYLESVDLRDLKKIREDHADEFSRFSGAILRAVQSMKAASDDQGFLQECRIIQRDLIDDSIDKLKARLHQISAMRFAGAAGITVGAVGLSFAAISGAALPMIATGLGTLTAGSIAVAAAEYKERFGLKDNPMKFLWRLR